MTEDANNAILSAYLQRVLEKNDELNLTAITSWDEAYTLHILDSLSAVQEINDAPSGWLIDMGTGGGFPGVPLAVATQRQAMLVDARSKKIAAIQAIVEDLGLSNIAFSSQRLEEIAGERRDFFAVATARALAPLPVLLELACPLLCEHGRLVAYKSAHITDELEQALDIQEKLGMQFVSERDINLGDDYPPRKIVVFEKVSQPSIELPRRVGMAQKKPLSRK